MATYEVKRQNPYPGARSCPAPVLDIMGSCFMFILFKTMLAKNPI